MATLFIFLDGVGLGEDNSATNPFVQARMHNLKKILNSEKLIYSTAPYVGDDVSLFSIDANLGVAGLPQSATGQAALLTGINVPQKVGYHYGPKPDKLVAEYLLTGGIFGKLTAAGKKAALINAYPEVYFDNINSGKRLYSAIPLAAVNAGLSLLNKDDLLAGRAMSADFTAIGWIERGLAPDIKKITPESAGRQLALLSKDYDFLFFEYWLTDYAGHRQDMNESVQILEQFDLVLGGLLDQKTEELLIIITSDHGNMEDLSTRRHTNNPVPLLVIGSQRKRQYFEKVTNLAGIFDALINAVE